MRGRYFILTQQARRRRGEEPGRGNEIVAANNLLSRAREVAAGIVKLPPLTSKYTRIGFTQRLRRIVDEGIGYGLALEGITAAEVARASAA